MRLARSILLLFALCSTLAWADSILVTSADLVAEDESIKLNAEFDFAFNPTLEEALQRGVPLYFVLDFELTRPRWWWLDEKIANTQVSYKLSYNALTRQYRLASGLYAENLASLDDVIRLLSRVRSRPVAEKAAIRKGGGYEAALRFRLDVAQLPKPFQLSALSSRDWTLQSDWYRWNPGF